ncbi:hypothetical protein ABW19_dt0200505 [Dactylella cylindrospora]|nr:hypothetical protein ABW19_dt0200505 [Dactylella cylindrospora]
MRKLSEQRNLIGTSGLTDRRASMDPWDCIRMPTLCDCTAARAIRLLRSRRFGPYRSTAQRRRRSRLPSGYTARINTPEMKGLSSGSLPNLGGVRLFTSVPVWHLSVTFECPASLEVRGLFHWLVVVDWGP